MTRARTFSSSWIIVSLLAAGSAGCSSPRVQVGSALHENASRYRTYAWAPSAEVSPETRLAATIKEATRRELARKKILETSPKKASIWVSYYAVTATGDSYGKPPGPWQWPPNEQAVSVRERSLTLEFIDPGTGKDLWQGTALDALDRADESAGRIDDAIAALLKKFP